ncbi:MAG: ATP-binding protein [Acidobacteriota bacterium]
MDVTDMILTSGAAALIAVVAVIWAVFLVRRAVNDRERTRRALLRLADGDLSARLDARRVDPHLATAFNQAAREVEERLSTARSSLDRLRDLVQLDGGRVLIGLDAAEEVEEVAGDVRAVTGHAAEGVLGRHAGFFFASEDTWPRLKVAAKREAVDLMPVAIRRRDGEVGQAHAGARFTADGLVLILAAQPGEAAIESDRTTDDATRLSCFLGALPEGIAILVDGVIASVNPRLARFLGLPPAELCGRLLSEFVVPRDLVRAAGLSAAGEVPEAEEEIDLSLRCPGGDEITLAVRHTLTQMDGRSVVVIAAREVGARRDLQRRLALYSAWLGATLDASPEGLAVLASPGSRGTWPVVIANERFLKLLDLGTDRLPSEDELHAAIEKTFADPDMVWSFLAGFEHEPGASGEGIFETRDEERTLRIDSGPVEGGSARRPVGRLLAIRDVTAACREKADLLARVTELTGAVAGLEKGRDAAQEAEKRARTQVEDLTRLNAELKELDEMKSNLLGNVSHELQTPLVSIKGYTEMMLRGDLGAITAEQRQGLEVSRRNTQRLIGLIDQLMTFARTEERLTELTLEAFPLWEVIEETINLLGDRIKEKSLRVTTRYRTDNLTVMADRDLISQVVINLLGNAIKFNEDGGEVAITVRASSADELVVEVRDTGVGIAREEQDRVFERGFRGSTAAGTLGSGIGLSVVREILRRHGCQIRVDSRPGEGTTFSFTLPLAAGEPGSDETLPPGESA